MNLTASLLPEGCLLVQPQGGLYPCYHTVRVERWFIDGAVFMLGINAVIKLFCSFHALASPLLLIEY